MAKLEYTNEERAEWLNVASEIGITRAMRKLGYPNSWATGRSWLEAAGIEAPLDSIKAQAAAHNQWYQDEELLLVAQEGISRVYTELQMAELDPDGHKKLSEAYQKYVNTMLTIKNRPNNITETRSRDAVDVELNALLAEQEKKNEESMNSLKNVNQDIAG